MNKHEMAQKIAIAIGKADEESILKIEMVLLDFLHAEYIRGLKEGAQTVMYAAEKVFGKGNSEPLKIAVP